MGRAAELPSGRKASILGYTDEGRLRLRYLGGNAVNGLVDLYPHHCRRLAKSESPG